MKLMFRICARYVHHSAAPRRQDDDAIRRCTLLKAETIAERHLKCDIFAKNVTFGGLRSFKGIDVDKTKKSVITVCYDKQHVCI